MNFELVAASMRTLISAEAEVTLRIREVPPSERYLVIPGSDGPRWIIPETPAWGMPVLRQWRPYDLASRAKWFLILAAYRAGHLAKLPGVGCVGVAYSCGGLDFQQLGLSADTQLVPVVYIGTPGPKRKAVAALVDRAICDPMFIVKTPLAPEASQSILHEASILEILMHDKPGVAPHPVSRESLRGMACQRAVTGHLGGRRLSGKHISWLENLQNGRTTTLEHHVAHLVRRLRETPEITPGELERVLALLDSIADHNLLPSCWVHGDFAPWNLKVRGTSMVAVDWEEAQQDGLPLQDLIHFQIVQSYLFRNNILIQDYVRNNSLVTAYRRRFEISLQQADKLTLYFLINAWLMRKQTGDVLHSAFISGAIHRMLEKF